MGGDNGTAGDSDRVDQRRPPLRFREHPFRFAAWCVTLIIFFSLLGWQTWVEIENPIHRPRWPTTALVMLTTIGGGVALSFMARSVWRTLRHEPRRSRKRAELWQAARSVLACFSFYALVLGGVSFWAAAKTYQMHAWITTTMRTSAPGFVLTSSVWDGPKGRELVMMLAAGLAFLVVAAVLAFCAYRAKPRLRRAQGKCVRCGYLLTGLSEARCPECGTAFDAGDLEADSADGGNR